MSLITPILPMVNDLENIAMLANFLAALRFVKAALHQDAEYAVNDLGGSSEVREVVASAEISCYVVSSG